MIFHWPLVDARHFLDPALHRRVGGRVFNLPLADETFLPCFGQFRKRLGNIGTTWPGMGVFCDIRRAIRFSGRLGTLPLLIGGKSPTPLTGARCGLRRLFSDGLNLHIEVGIGWPSIPPDADLCQLLCGALDIPVVIAARVPRAKTALGALARPFARQLLEATTCILEAGTPANAPKPWWLSVGAPMVVCEILRFRGRPPAAIEQGDPVSVECLAGTGVSLRFLTLGWRGRRIDTWLLIHEPDCDPDVLRRLRILLTAIQVETENLQTVFSLVGSGRLEVAARSDISDRLQAYLKSAFDTIGRTHRFGIPQTPMLLAARSARALVKSDEREALLATLAHVRPSVYSKLEQYLILSDNDTPRASNERNFMITLLAASQIATIAGNAINIIDKIYTQFTGFRNKTKAGETITDGLQITNETKEGALVARSGDTEVQRVSYDDLRMRLDDNDLKYISALQRSISNKYNIWTRVYPQLSLSDPVERARIELNLDEISHSMDEDLHRVLDFVEQRVGITLTGHYQHIRAIAGDLSPDNPARPK